MRVFISRTNSVFHVGEYAMKRNIVLSMLLVCQSYHTALLCLVYCKRKSLSFKGSSGKVEQVHQKNKKKKKQYRIYFFGVICHEFSSFYRYVERFINNGSISMNNSSMETYIFQSKKLSRSLLAISIQEPIYPHLL